MMSFTLFDTNWFYENPKHGDPRWVFDNECKVADLDWLDFLDIISSDGHAIFETKQKGPMFNFTRYLTKEEGATMSKKGFTKKLKENAVSVDALILDYDSPDAPSIQEFTQLYGEYEFLIYTSYSHDPANGKVKYRVVLPLTNTAPAHLVENPDGLTPAQQTYLPALTEYFLGVDACCFQPNRSFYFPACKNEDTLAVAEMHYNEGKYFNLTDGTLSVSYGTNIPYVPRPSTGVVGGAGRIVYPTFDIVRFFQDQGLYLTNKGGGRHLVECPIAHEHTGGDKTGTVIFEASSTGMPGIKCQHHGAQLITFKWLIDFYRTHLGDDAFREYCETEPYQDNTEVFEGLRKKSTKLRLIILTKYNLSEDDYQDYLEND